MPKKVKKAAAAAAEDEQIAETAAKHTESDDLADAPAKSDGGKRKVARKGVSEANPAAEKVKKSRKALKSAVESSEVSEQESETGMGEIKETEPTSTRKSKRASAVKIANGESETEPTGPAKKSRGKKVKEIVSETEPEAKKLKATSEKSEKVTSKQTEEKVVIERTPIARYIPKGRSFKVISWNVTTLRSLINKNASLLKLLIEKENPDLVCLQETKLNSEDQEEYEAKLKKLIPGYSYYWNFCTLPGSKSYSGTLAIVRGESGTEKAQTKTLDSFFTKDSKKSEEQESSAAEPVVGVSMGVPTLTEADGAVAKEVIAEGRTITVEYEAFYVVASYVPNSGDKLQRLDFRTKVWDKRMGEYLVDLEKRKPVIFCGDLNVAHLDSDIWNVGAKHLAKSAGTTPEERQSFSDLLALGYVDAFRQLNPGAAGWFSYWSVRAGNRPFNRGLRLDYFVTSPKLCGEAVGKAEVKEVAILPDFVAIDHAAIALTLAL